MTEEGKRKRERHGETSGGVRTKEHSAWHLMLERCYNENNASYGSHGGRGIQVCDRWRSSFLAFLEDVGRAPSPAHSLDRYPDPNGNYEPGNVRWATWKQQQRNRTNTPFVTYKGELMPMSEAAERAGLKYITVHARHRRGLRGDELFKPAATKTEVPPVLYQGKLMSLMEASKASGIMYELLYQRYKKGVPADELLKPTRPYRKKAS